MNEKIIPNQSESDLYEYEEALDIDTQAMMKHFSFLENKKPIPIEEHEKYRKELKEKFGITKFQFNDNGGITISWADLVRTYRNQMNAHSLK